MKESILHLKTVTAEISHDNFLKDISWKIDQGTFWAVLGTNASGKSGLGQLIAGRLDIVSGTIEKKTNRIGYVSFEKHAEIMEDLVKNDDTDFMDRIDTGTIVQDFIAGNSTIPKEPRPKIANNIETMDEERLNALARAFGIDHLLHRGIRFLSTGEIRKAMICQALISSPELLILDEPYDGVDTDSRKTIAEAVAALNAQGMAVVLILNRISQIPHEATHILYVSNCRIELQGPRDEILHGHEAPSGGRPSRSSSSSAPSSYSSLSSSISPLARLHSLHTTLPDTLPPKDPGQHGAKNGASPFPLFSTPPPDPMPPLIKMEKVTVQYGDHVVLDGLNWEVKQGKHWKISGPNGAGKSTLLSLVNGDNPQAYCNTIYLFGRRRGSGESIWDIKRHTGIVSSRFQLDYRVSSSILGVVISGFFDSIGVYKTPSKQQKTIALAWLEVIGMAKDARKPFKKLSYGEQRMVLIVRAMVKHPTLLILDEPCQGLDDINRHMVLKLIDHIGQTGTSTLLYVTHHDEDRLECIQKSLRLTL